MWLYKNKVINKLEDLPEGTFGFIYKITNKTDGKFYIGKKQIMSQTNVKLGKKELAEQPVTRGRTSTTKQIIKESDWKTYYGSHSEIKGLIKEGKQKEFTREILQLVTNKKLLTYYECKYLFMLGVIEKQDGYFNDNILGKFFRKDFAE